MLYLVECLAAVEHRPSAVAQAAPDVRIGGGQRRRAPKNRSKLGGSGGMPPGKFFFLIVQNAAN